MNLSRPEIASELSVSVNTVNTHIRNVCAKLGAQDRSSAVQRARATAAFGGPSALTGKSPGPGDAGSPCHPDILASWTFQHYVLGTATVWRIGFGATVNDRSST
jgi:hypothetical protein